MDLASIKSYLIRIKMNTGDTVDALKKFYEANVSFLDFEMKTKNSVI